MNADEPRITDSQINEIDALFADLEWIDFKRPVWKAVKARLTAAEAERDEAQMEFADALHENESLWERLADLKLMCIEQHGPGCRCPIRLVASRERPQ